MKYFIPPWLQTYLLTHVLYLRVTWLAFIQKENVLINPLWVGRGGILSARTLICIKIIFIQSSMG